VGFDAIGLGGSEQTHDGGGALASGFGAGEQPVLAPDGDRPDEPPRVLRRLFGLSQASAVAA